MILRRLTFFQICSSWKFQCVHSLKKEICCCVGLALYFGAEQLVDAFLRRLRAIEEWFLNQTSYSFIASSLLFIYDSDAVYRRSRTANGVATPGDEHCLGSLSNHNDLCGSTTFDSNNNYDDVTDVRIIDLTHVFHTTGPDTNYLTGLRSLMAYLTKLDKSFNDRL